MIQYLISTTLIFSFALSSFAATPRETSLESFAELKKKMEEVEQTIENNEEQAAHITLVLRRLTNVTKQEVEILQNKAMTFLVTAEKNKTELSELKHKANAQLLLARSSQKDQTNKMTSLLKEIKDINEKLQKLLPNKDQKELQSLTIRKDALNHQAQIIADEIIKSIDLITRYTRLIKEKNQENTASCEV